MTDRELLYALRRELRLIRQTVEAIHNESRTHNNQQQPPHQVDIQSEIHLPPAINDYYASEKNARKGKTRRETAIVILQGLALFAAVVAAFYAYRTFTKVGIQADAAQAQASIIQQQLETADRPWVKLVAVKRPIISFIGPSFRMKLGLRDEAFLNVIPEIKNIGRSTAIQVRMDINIVVHKWTNGWGDFSREKAEACLAAAKSRNTDIVLFPEDPFDGRDYGSSVFLTPDNTSETNNVKYVAPALAGCIDYRYATSSRSHQTAFVYEIVRADNRSRVFVLGQGMRPESIALIRDSQYDSAN